MLDSPLLFALLITVLAPFLSWLVNQLPSMPELPGKKALIFKLTLEVIFLPVVFSWLKDFPHDSEEWLKSAAHMAVLICSGFFLWHITQLGMMIWRARRHNTVNQGVRSGQPNTSLTTPDQWQQGLLKAIKTEVAKRLRDSLHNEIMISLRTEDQPQQINRPNQQVLNTKPKPQFNPMRILSPIFGGEERKLKAADGRPTYVSLP